VFRRAAQHGVAEQPKGSLGSRPVLPVALPIWGPRLAYACSCSTPSGAGRLWLPYAAAAAAPLPVSLLSRPLATYPEAATAFHRVGCSAVGVAT
jgi:hypothetical protein